MSYHFYDMGFKDGYKKALQQLDEQRMGGGILPGNGNPLPGMPGGGPLPSRMNNNRAAGPRSAVAGGRGGRGGAGGAGGMRRPGGSIESASSAAIPPGPGTYPGGVIDPQDGAPLQVPVPECPFEMPPGSTYEYVDGVWQVVGPKGYPLFYYAYPPGAWRPTTIEPVTNP